MSEYTRWSETADMVFDCVDSYDGPDPEAAVREVARLLRERHPELVEPPWTPVAEGLPPGPGNYLIHTRGLTRIGEWVGGSWSNETQGDVKAWAELPEWDGGTP